MNNFTRGSPELSQKARLALKLPRCAPRERQPGEATPVVIANSTTKEPYSTGYGELRQPIRQGAMRALQIPSHGVRT